jgi:hypothetical protein
MDTNVKLHLKLYFQACLLALYVMIIVGFLTPCLISADDVFLPVLGVLILLSVPPVVWIVSRHIYIALGGQNEKKKNDYRGPGAPRAR